MRKIIREKESTLSQIKKRQKDISDSINSGKKEISELYKTEVTQQDAIKSNYKLIDELSEDITIKKAEIEQITYKLNHVMGDLRKVEGEIELKKKDSEILLDKIDKDRRKILDNFEIDFKSAAVKLATVNERIDKAGIILKSCQKEFSDINKSIKIKANSIEVLNKDIRFKEKTIDTLQKEIKALEHTSQSLIQLKETNSKVMAEIDHNRQILSQLKISIKNLNTERSEGLKVVGDREHIVLRREKELNIEIKAVEDREKRVKKLGKTLQDHYDKQQIPIKVF